MKKTTHLTFTGRAEFGWVALLVIMMSSVALFGGCSAGTTPSNDNNMTPPSTGGAGEPITFSNGGFEISARTVQSASVSNTTINEAGQILVDMETTLEKITFSFPTEGSDLTTIVFNTPLDVLPSEFATNRLATFVAGQLFGVGGGLRPDNPGCDMFPDTRCTLRCCADHDRCYAANSCGFTSWLPFVGSDACNNCNHVAASCITSACAFGTEGDPSSDVCFDASCGKSYTCPSPNEFDCFACASPCAGTPETCGNGSCDLTETVENCASDCATGLGVNVCCMENNNCPSETPTNCPGDCCCCGLGEVCGAGEICRPG